MHKYWIRLTLAIIVLSSVIFLTSTKLYRIDEKNYSNNLQIINGKNQQIADFKVKIVSKGKELERGLMFVNKLPKNFGMLFEFADEKLVYMWMKNTKISLDMLFIDKNNNIVHIKHSATPESFEIISSQKEVVKVLEINGHLSKKLNINIGDHIQLESKNN